MHKNKSFCDIKTHYLFENSKNQKMWLLEHFLRKTLTDMKTLVYMFV